MSLRVDAYIREGDGVTHRIASAKDGDWIGVVITINNTTEFDITAFDTSAAGKLAGIFEHAAIEFRNFVDRKCMQRIKEGLENDRLRVQATRAESDRPA